MPEFPAEFTKSLRRGALPPPWCKSAYPMAKNVVASGLASKCEVQIAYAIGVARPVSVMIDTQGTGRVSDEIIEKAVCEVFDLRPAAIIEMLDLRRPIYKQLAAYGHFGREELNVPWERKDKAAALKAAADSLK